MSTACCVCTAWVSGCWCRLSCTIRSHPLSQSNPKVIPTLFAFYDFVIFCICEQLKFNLLWYIGVVCFIYLKIVTFNLDVVWVKQNAFLGKILNTNIHVIVFSVLFRQKRCNINNDIFKFYIWYRIAFYDVPSHFFYRITCDKLINIHIRVRICRRVCNTVEIKCIRIVNVLNNIERFSFRNLFKLKDKLMTLISSVKHHVLILCLTIYGHIYCRYHMILFGRAFYLNKSFVSKIHPTACFVPIIGIWSCISHIHHCAQFTIINLQDFHLGRWTFFVFCSCILSMCFYSNKQRVK